MHFMPDVCGSSTNTTLTIRRFFLALLTYADRTDMSIVTVPLEMNLNESQVTRRCSGRSFLWLHLHSNCGRVSLRQSVRWRACFVDWNGVGVYAPACHPNRHPKSWSVQCNRCKNCSRLGRGCLSYLHSHNGAKCDSAWMNQWCHVVHCGDGSHVAEYFFKHWIERESHLTWQPDILVFCLGYPIQRSG